MRKDRDPIILIAALIAIAFVLMVFMVYLGETA